MKKVICRSIFVLLAVGGFAALAICIQLGVTQGFDEWVYGWVSQTITPVLTEFLKIITYAGDVFVIIRKTAVSMNSVMNMVFMCTMRRILKVMECIMIGVRVESCEIIRNG